MDGDADVVGNDVALIGVAESGLKRRSDRLFSQCASPTIIFLIALRGRGEERGMGEKSEQSCITWTQMTAASRRSPPSLRRTNGKK